MFKRKSAPKIRLLFVDENNDLQSNIAEYFVKEMYGDLYEVSSAGPKSDCVDCELISVMYPLGYDIRSYTSMDFGHEDLPKGFDYVIFLEKSTYDRVKDDIPFKAPQILHDFGRKENFEKATDDVELYECIKQLVENVGEWCKSTFADPEALKTMVV